jgi:butyryl-CoA dehydrogenase
MDEVLAGTREESAEGPLSEECRLVGAAKKIALFAAGVATQKYMQALQNEQEIMGAIATMSMEAYAMESAVLRTRKMFARNGDSSALLATAMTRVYLMGAMERIESAARTVLAAASDGDSLRTHIAILRRLLKFDPFDRVALRRLIAHRMIEAGKYVVI